MDPKFMEALLLEKQKQRPDNGNVNVAINADTPLMVRIKHWLSASDEGTSIDQQFDPASLLVTDSNGLSPLGHAAAWGIAGAVTYLLRLDPQGGSAPSSRFRGVPYTPLMLACYHRRTHCVKRLLHAGCSMHSRVSSNAENCGVRAALAVSAQELLTAPGDVNAVDASNFSHWTFLCHSPVASISIFKWMLRTQGADPNARDSRGTPMLHVAASLYAANRVRALVESGATTSALDQQGRSAAAFLAAYLDTAGERPDRVGRPTDAVIDALYDALWSRGIPESVSDIRSYPLLVHQQRRLRARVQRKRGRSD